MYQIVCLTRRGYAPKIYGCGGRGSASMLTIAPSIRYESSEIYHDK